MCLFSLICLGSFVYIASLSLQEELFHFRTVVTASSLTYGIRKVSLTSHSNWASIEFFPDPTSAVRALRRVTYANKRALCKHAYAAFGFRCKEVQEWLYTATKELHQPSARKPLDRVPLKMVVKRAVLKAKQQEIKEQNSKPQDDSHYAFGFKYSSTQKTVQEILNVISNKLIDGRDEVKRATQIMAQLLNHPDVKKLCEVKQQQTFGWGTKDGRVIASFVTNMRALIATHKDKRSNTCCLQSLYDDCSPPSWFGFAPSYCASARPEIGQRFAHCHDAVSCAAC